MKYEKFNSDFLVIGSGLAGLSSAYYASQYGSVNLITKNKFRISSTYWAQGGIAAAIGKNDSADLHYDETLNAGGDFCDENAVRVLVNEGIDRVNEIIDLGMQFDEKDGEILLGLEGGHSKRRILHAGGDSTGSKVVDFFSDLIYSKKNINVFQNTVVMELLENENIAIGANAYDWENKKQLIFNSPVTIVATGGGSGIYSRTTNPYTSVGDGIALAYNIGAEIQDMEFLQFHPTAFYSDSGETFLISEAVRGEGAYLENGEGIRFLENVHPLKELAPRDIVSKAIFNELQNSNYDSVFLNLRHLDANRIKQRFSNIYKSALLHEIDITKDLVPVAPAAHYMIGGIKTDLNGKTNIDGLFACGEVTSTGVHGANRLASNSLLECLVFGKRVVDSGLEFNKKINNNLFELSDIAEYRIDSANIKSFIDRKNYIANLMNNKVGILRSKVDLIFALNEIENISSMYAKDIYEYYNNQLINLTEICKLIIKSALEREESRGTHQRSDFPNTNYKLKQRNIFRK